MKSIRTDPLNHAAKGDERIRTAVCSLGADLTYEQRGAIRRVVVSGHLAQVSGPTTRRLTAGEIQGSAGHGTSGEATSGAGKGPGHEFQPHRASRRCPSPAVSRRVPAPTKEAT